MLKTLDPTPPVHVIRPGDRDWRFVEEFMTYPRAGLEISDGCPPDYREMLLEAVDRGYIKPVAFMKESDYVWEKLQQD